METNERLPIPNEKISLFRRIYNKLFYKKPEESEISKIAEKLSLETQYEPKENSEKGFVPDKRTVVYDFFEKNIPEAPIKGETLRYGYGRRGSGFEEKVEFKNESGNKRSFSLTKDKELSNGSLRISLSYMTTEEEIDRFLEIFDECYKKLEM